jgi:hypothetical protein
VARGELACQGLRYLARFHLQITVRDDEWWRGGVYIVYIIYIIYNVYRRGTGTLFPSEHINAGTR